ncbi:MAG TPA: hypothetical protein VLN74_12205 [Ilumatobacteraceae bacterium]|nr:hypothetical protein [Ilumatobacteraceae bacterium]
MFTTLGQLVVRRRRTVLVTTLLAPAPLRRLHDRFGISEAPPEEMAAGEFAADERHGAPVGGSAGQGSM